MIHKPKIKKKVTIKKKKKKFYSRSGLTSVNLLLIF